MRATRERGERCVRSPDEPVRARVQSGEPAFLRSDGAGNVLPNLRSLDSVVTTLTWRTDHEPDAECVERVAQGVISHGRSLAGVGEPKSLACFVFDRTALIGGVTGRVEFERLFVQYLWVEEARRNCGLGTELLARIERAASEMHCSDVLVETLSDRMAAMYRRLGYNTMGQIANYIPGYTRHVLLKRLGT